MALLGIGSLCVLILEQRLVGNTIPPLWGIFSFFLLTLFSWFFSIQLPNKHDLHLGMAVYFACLLILGPLAATVASAASAIVFMYVLYLTQPRLNLAVVSGPLAPPSPFLQVPLLVFREQIRSNLLRRRVPHLRIAANVCVVIVSTGIGGLLWGLFSPQSFTSGFSVGLFLVCSAAVNISNLFLSSFGVQMDYGVPFAIVWRSGSRSLFLSSLILAPLGYAVAFLLQEQPLALILLLPIFAATHYATRRQAGILVETEKTIVFLAKVLESRDKYTFDHSKKVGTYARGIALAMGLGDEKASEIEKAAWMHDIGKIAVEDSVLHKDGRLTSGEVAHMMQHISVLPELFEHRQFLSKYWGAFFHHERYDGTGYMHGLKEEEIPLEGRIIAVADVYDALTSDRPYRKGLPKEEALDIIRKGRGTHFDPGIVDVFLKCLETGS